MAGGPIFRAAFALVAGQVHELPVDNSSHTTLYKHDLQLDTKGIKQEAAQGVWQLANTLRYSIGNAMTHHIEQGVCLQAIKFLA